MQPEAFTLEGETVALADLLDQPQTCPPRTCVTCWLLETLPAEGENGSEALRAALARRDITHQAIATELEKVGHKVAAQTIGRHRAGRCQDVTR